MVKKLFLLFLMVFALSFAFACNEDKKYDDDKQNEETKEFTVTFDVDGEKSEVKVWECRNCGHIVIGKQAPEVCPVCTHPKAYFEIKAENY